MLLIALLCQAVFQENGIAPSPLTSGAIIVGDVIPTEKERGAFWNAISSFPVARVDGTLVTVDDVLYSRRSEALNWQPGVPVESRSQQVQYLIGAYLPNAIERAALWNQVQQDFPTDLFEASWNRHEQVWEQNLRLLEKKPRNEQSSTEAVNWASWKPHYLKQLVSKDYLRWKLVDEQPADALRIVDDQRSYVKRAAAVLSDKLVSELEAIDDQRSYAKRVTIFRRKLRERAKVETAFDLSIENKTPTTIKLHPGQPVEYRTRKTLKDHFKPL
ncbi:MAG: hypothetical protein U0872_17155 [Planctomycetaceae bacterium]